MERARHREQKKRQQQLKQQQHQQLKQQQHRALKVEHLVKRTLINSININCVIKNLFIKLNKQMELNQEHSVYKQEKINCT